MADDVDAGTLFSLHALKVTYTAYMRMQPLRIVPWLSKCQSCKSCHLRPFHASKLASAVSLGGLRSTRQH